MNVQLRDFESQILYFNGMYKLPVASYPTVYKEIKHEKERLQAPGISGIDALISRLGQFYNILKEELTEIDDIVTRLKLGMQSVDGEMVEYTELDCLVDLADWLGDIQVYCASEMARYGLPLKDVLRIIMQSNFSKLDANGQPIYDERGKVQKGPMYWKPEPMIKALLKERIEEALATQKVENIEWK